MGQEFPVSNHVATFTPKSLCAWRWQCVIEARPRITVFRSTPGRPDPVVGSIYAQPPGCSSLDEIMVMGQETVYPRLGAAEGCLNRSKPQLQRSPTWASLMICPDVHALLHQQNPLDPRPHGTGVVILPTPEDSLATPLGNDSGRYPA